MRITELRDQTIEATQVEDAEDIFQLAFIDKGNGDIIFLRFGAEVRDFIVKQFQPSSIEVAKTLPFPKGGPL